MLSLDKIKEVLSYDVQSPLIFNSGLFLFLFLAFTIAYYSLRHRDTPRILFVTLFSYYFYYKSSGFYFFLPAIVTVSDFYIAKYIHNSEVKRIRKALLLLSLTINLGLLGYFKYTNFLLGNIADIFGGSFDPLDIFLPVGISFFIFQSMSYTIDIYRRNIAPLERLLDYAFYVSFFPQLVAGPIVRAKDFISQIRQPLFVSREMFGYGTYLIFAGLFKKAVISDYISVNFVERIFENPALYSGVENLFGVYGYSLQIYCDFSGYSDMAIGLALLLGFKFPENFNSPYLSVSITEFWRRWHISLSSWLKDYLYISLGGNRKGKIRTYANLLITMLLGGLWHGASWNFVIWGGLHGMALAIHKYWMGLRKGVADARESWWIRVLSVFITFHFVCLGWIFFRNQSFESSITMLKQIFGHFNLSIFPQMLSGYTAVMILILVGYVIHFLPKRLENKSVSFVSALPFYGKVIMFVLLIFLIIQIKTSEVQPFIYFQF